MPTRPASPCPKCYRLKPCPIHDKDLRPSAAARGYGSQHQRWRAVILARDPICKRCNKARSTHADHIVPLRQGGTWAYTNGQGLCQSCHSAVTALYDGGFGHSTRVGK